MRIPKTHLKKKHYFIVGSFIFLALLLRLTVLHYALISPAGYLTPDSSDYINLAKNIFSGFSYYNSSGEPEIFRIPGYPFFISIIWFLTGKSIISMLFVQVVLDIVTCLITWQVYRELFNNDNISSYYSLFFQCISIVSIAFSVKILSETLFTFLLTLTILLLLRIDKNTKYSYLLFTGIFIAFLCITRAIAIPLIVLFLFFIYFKIKRISKLVWILIPIILILCGWSLRNYIQAGYPGVSSVGKINIYRYNACALLAKQNNITFSEQQKECDNKLANYKTQKGKALFSQEEGLKIIFKNPMKYFIIHLKTSINSLLPATGNLLNILGYKIGNNNTLAVINSRGLIQGIKHYFNNNWLLFIFTIPFTVMLFIKYFSVLVSFLSMLRSIFSYSSSKNFKLERKNKTCKLYCGCNAKNKWTHIFLLLIILYFLIIPGPASTPRFRVPIAPLLSIYAGYGITLIFYFLKKRFLVKK